MEILAHRGVNDIKDDVKAGGLVRGRCSTGAGLRILEEGGDPTVFARGAAGRGG